MASSTLALHDPQFAYAHPSPFCDGRDGAYRDILPFFAGLYPPFFNGDNNALNHEQAFDCFMPSSYTEDEGDYTSRVWGNSQLLEENYQGEEPAYDGYDNWPAGQDPIYRWQESFFSLRDDLAGNESASDLERMDNSHYQSYSHMNLNEQEENQMPYPYDPLPGYGSWSDTEWEENPPQHYVEREQRVSLSELGLCESIFGYWATGHVCQEKVRRSMVSLLDLECIGRNERYTGPGSTSLAGRRSLDKSVYSLGEFCCSLKLLQLSPSTMSISGSLLHFVLPSFYSAISMLSTKETAT